MSQILQRPDRRVPTHAGAITQTWHRSQTSFHRLTKLRSEWRGFLSTPWFIHWGIQAAALIMLCGWLAFDTQTSGLSTDTNSGWYQSVVSFFYLAMEFDTCRMVCMVLLIATPCLSLLCWTASTLVGKCENRSIISFLAIMSVVAAWLSCLGCWHDVGWFGKSLRSRSYIAALEPIKCELEDSWPVNNGERSHIGPFLAYPSSRPTSLILMSCPKTPPGTPSCNGVERTPNGGLGFPMIGNDGGDWIEWHPQGRSPTSYRTGLQQELVLHRVAHLRDGWFLVRYKQ